MLVLALQFSKGVAGAGIVRTRSPNTPWQRSSRARAGREGLGRVAGSLKTEEKTRTVASGAKGGEPTTFVLETTEPTVHQLGTGSHRIGRMPIIDGTVLLRKEVIQPHLPVRLPCYDFTPITDPTFDGSFLTVRPPASGVADFRGVTGGVYKARERIHPGVLIRDY